MPNITYDARGNPIYGGTAPAYTAGPNQGYTSDDMKNQVTSGGAGSYYNTDLKTGQTQVNIAPNLLGQENQYLQEQLKLKAKLASDAFNQRMAAIGTSGGGSAPQVQHAGAGGSEGLAQAMAFGQAKDTAGQLALGALKSLQSGMAERGLTGSTDEANATAGIFNNATGQINAANKDQLLAQLARQAAVNDMQYQGGIQQRGQDLNAQQAMWSLISSGLGVY